MVSPLNIKFDLVFFAHPLTFLDNPPFEQELALSPTLSLTHGASGISILATNLKLSVNDYSPK